MSLRSLSLLCVAASAAAQGSSSRLRVEYLDAPLTIDVATPRFGRGRSSAGDESEGVEEEEEEEEGALDGCDS